MIGFLHGNLIEKHPPEIIVDVQGVGYELAVPMTTIYALPELGSELKLYTHLLVREDLQALYGFISKRDRKLFRDLLKVNGVGAKMALAILSGMDADTFVRCILDEDSGMLTSIPGIGKKVAERLIIEMKDRLAKWSDDIDLQTAPGIQQHAANMSSFKQAEADAISALEALGYRSADASKAVKALTKESSELASEELIRLALQNMTKRA